jgi:hypothetical protein
MLPGLPSLEERLAKACGPRPAKCSGYRDAEPLEVVQDVLHALDQFAKRHNIVVRGGPGGIQENTGGGLS